LLHVRTAVRPRAPTSPFPISEAKTIEIRKSWSCFLLQNETEKFCNSIFFSSVPGEPHNPIRSNPIQSSFAPLIHPSIHPSYRRHAQTEYIIIITISPETLPSVSRIDEERKIAAVVPTFVRSFVRSLLACMNDPFDSFIDSHHCIAAVNTGLDLRLHRTGWVWWYACISTELGTQRNGTQPGRWRWRWR